jgi:hypothetical protein
VKIPEENAAERNGQAKERRQLNMPGFKISKGTTQECYPKWYKKTVHNWIQTVSRCWLGR